jgi:hypothetical protein
VLKSVLYGFGIDPDKAKKDARDAVIAKRARRRKENAKEVEDFFFRNVSAKQEAAREVEVAADCDGMAKDIDKFTTSVKEAIGTFEESFGDDDLDSDSAAFLATLKSLVADLTSFVGDPVKQQAVDASYKVHVLIEGDKFGAGEYKKTLERHSDGSKDVAKLRKDGTVAKALTECEGKTQHVANIAALKGLASAKSAPPTPPAPKGGIRGGGKGKGKGKGGGQGGGNGRGNGGGNGRGKGRQKRRRQQELDADVDGDAADAADADANDDE